MLKAKRGISWSLIKRGFTQKARLQAAPEIVGLCNPLIDLTLEVDDPSYLEFYQIKPGNAILADKPIHQKLIEDVWKQHKELKKVTAVPGGSGLNTIRAANYMIKATHPEVCKFSGSIG